MDIYSIYKSTNLINNKVYIGYTNNFYRRVKEHKKLSETANSKFYNAIRKYGWDNFEWEIIYQSIDKNYNQNIMEPFFITETNSHINGYNGSKGGEGNDSETISRIVENAWKNPNSGYNTKEYRLLKSKNLIELRANVYSIFNTEQYKQKVGNNTKELWDDPESAFNSKEYVEKQSISLKLQWDDPNSTFNSPEYRKSKRDSWENPNSGFQKLKRSYIITDPDGVVYRIIGLRKFCRENNLSQSYMTEIAQGKKLKYKGWVCKYD